MTLTLRKWDTVEHLQTEEDMVQRWVDHRLSTACREGYTLVYDEFTRSKPEANNVLLSVLEERLLILNCIQVILRHQAGIAERY